MSTRVVCAEGIKVISLEGNKAPHVIIIFKGTSIEEIKRNRPRIEGVSLDLLKFLGEHKDVQKWDFLLWDGKVALLVPKRYIILTRDRILFRIRILSILFRIRILSILFRDKILSILSQDRILSICLLFEEKEQ